MWWKPQTSWETKNSWHFNSENVKLVPLLKSPESRGFPAFLFSTPCFKGKIPYPCCMCPVSTGQVLPVDMNYMWVGTMLRPPQTAISSCQHMPKAFLSTEPPFSPIPSCPPPVSASYPAPVSVWIEHPQPKCSVDTDCGWNQFCCNMNLVECIMYLWRDRRNIYQVHYRLNEPGFREVE